MITKTVATIIQEVSPLFGEGAGAGAAAAGAGAATAAVAGAAAGVASAVDAAAGAGAACSVAAGAGDAAVGSSAITGMASPNPSIKLRLINSFLMWLSSKCIRTGFTGTDADNLFNVGDKNLAVTDLAGMGCFLYGLQHLVQDLGFDCCLDFHFG